MTMEGVVRYVVALRHNQRFQQAGTLYVSMVLVMVIGFITSVINTRSLGPKSYGDYKFILNIFQFFSVVSTLGIFTTGSQLLAQIRDECDRKSPLMGGLIIFAGLLSAGLAVVVGIFSLLEPAIFGNHLTLEILLFSPMVAIAIFQPCLEGIFQGDNRIHDLSLFRLLPNVIYMLLLVAVSKIWPLNLHLTLLIQLFAGLSVTLVYVLRIRPVYADFASVKRLIWKANKRFGLHVYVGSLSGVATTYVATFLISYFLDNTNVGFYALAVTLTLPLMQISSIIGTTFFKDFATVRFLPTRVTVVTIALAVTTLGVFLGIVEPFVLAIYTASFQKVVALASVIAIGSTLYGIGDYFNRFLGAHGCGKELRNGAIAVGVSNVLGSFILIGLMGVEGAAITKVLSGLVYCSTMVSSYIRFIKRDKEPVPCQPE